VVAHSQCIGQLSQNKPADELNLTEIKFFTKAIFANGIGIGFP